MSFDIGKEIAKETDAYLREKGIKPMAAISKTYVLLTIEVGGVSVESEAEVSYIYSKAMPGYHEKGGGQIDPDEPERAEIQTVRVPMGQPDANGKAPLFDIAHLLTDAQIEEIELEVLEQGA